MKLLVDALDSTSGWTGTGSVTAAKNEVASHIAGNGGTGSLLFHFPAGSQGKLISKDLSGSPVDVSAYDKLIFSVWSRNKGRTRYTYYADCAYRLRLTTSPDERYIRAWRNFSQEEIDVSDIDSIDQITFVAEHDDDDYLLVSLMVAEAQQSPFDLLTGVEEALNYYVGLLHDPGLALTTTITGSADDASVTLSDAYLDRYAVVQFGDTGSGTEEVHMLLERDGEDFTFGEEYGGRALQYAHTADTVYLLFPVGIGGHETEVTLPGISIWAMTPDPVSRGTDLDEVRYDFRATTTGLQHEGKIVNYPVLIDCEARQYEILELLTDRVRAMMSTDHALWINGRKHDIEWTEIPVELEPTEAQDITPKIQYTLNVEIKEELWLRISRPLAGQATMTYNPILQGQGSLP